MTTTPYQLSTGLWLVNCTPHELNFLMDDGSIETVPASGYVISAEPVERALPFGQARNYSLVEVVWTTTNEGETILDEIYNTVAAVDFLIVGSAVACQAYPNDLVMTTPASGYERSRERLLNPHKFTAMGT